MAYRTTLAAVQLLSDDFTSMTADQLEPAIAWAHIIVTDQIVGDSATTSVKLELITRYLAAHAAVCFVREATEERAGSVSARYEGNAAKGARLDSTRFGKNAILLDDTGALAALSAMSKKAQVAGVRNLWKEPSAW